MIREVDLISYLPPFIAEYEEIRAALLAEESEFKFVWEAADKILRNGFISTSDAYGISRYEKLLGILPQEGESLEDRKARVRFRWFNALPYTLRMLKERIGQILEGAHRFDIRIDSSYELILEVYTTDDGKNSELKYALETMIPMNMEASILYEAPLQGTFFFGGIMNEADVIEIKQR